MSIKNCNVKVEYRSLKDNVVQEFYLPLLKEAIDYKRAVGFFSSTALIEISKGIADLARNGGHIRMVASPYLSDEDIEAIRQGYANRDEIIEKALFSQLTDEKLDYFSMERLNLLANLISDGVMDIKIAYTDNDHDIGMYHEKMGVISDSEGNRVAFSGSMNESSMAINFNYETIDVFTSWNGDGDLERVNIKDDAFEKIWNDEDPGVSVKEFKSLTDEIIKKYKKSPADYDLDNKQFGVYDKKTHVSDCDKALGARIPDTIQLHQYQKDAISNWVGENYRGIFDMATGTGKTFTGLGAISKISEDLSDNLAVIIICPFQHLVDQGVEDIIRFNIKPIIGYSTSPQKDWKKRLSGAVRDQKLRPDKPFFCFISTNATFSSDYVQQEISKIKKPILLVVDEAHNVGARSYLNLLDDRFKYRLALSATLERHRDEEGTRGLYDFFGRKCIEYSLEQAIKEDKLTPYKYFPVLVNLNDDELIDYENLSYELSKHVIVGKNGKTKLDSYGEILAIQRSKIVAGAALKIGKLLEVIEPFKNDHYLLVYCGATNVLKPTSDSSETDMDSVRQIEAVVSLLGNTLDMKVSKFTAAENIDERGLIKEHFESGDDLQAIVAIKCLDEGVNIPGIQKAFILASTTNPKEYIQRRGRVLRKYPGKDYAEIYDFVTLPRPLDEVSSLTEEQMRRDLSLVKNELSRMIEFGRMAINSMDTNKVVWEICDTYNLPYECFDENVEDAYEF